MVKNNLGIITPITIDFKLLNFVTLSANNGGDVKAFFKKIQVVRKLLFLSNLDSLKSSLKIFLFSKNVTENLFIPFLDLRGIVLEVISEAMAIIPTLINNILTIMMFKPAS